MKTHFVAASFLVLVLLAMGVFVSTANGATSREPVGKYLYDEQADAQEDIAAALATAKKDGKNVLLQFGANWCGWCHLLHELFETNQTIAAELRTNYVVVRVDVNKGHNIKVVEKYGNPTQLGLPAIVILDAEGKQLTTQDTGKLEAGNRHDPEKVLEFLKKWEPKKGAAAATEPKAKTDG